MNKPQYIDCPLPSHIGVVNPYALAELLVGQAIQWDRVDLPKFILERVFEMPYEELFDPQYPSPLYPGLALDEALEIRRAAAEPPEEADAETDEMALADPDISRFRKLGDFLAFIGEKKLSDLKIERPEVVRPGYIRFEVRLPHLKEYHIETVFGSEISRLVGPAEAEEGDWNPPGVEWRDPGDFFKEAAEFSDPIQGVVGDCYFVAALASLAWARPYDIVHRTRATGVEQERFVNMIRFFSTGRRPTKEVEVTERLPLRAGSHRFIYCRSREAGEIWPALYEKAYAVWRSGADTDRPNIPNLAGGDPVAAAAHLTGLGRYYYGTRGRSPDDLWGLVRSNSRSYKTFNPMVAWTYSSGDKSPDGIRYSDANLVANHAYSVLGWAYWNGKKYIVLRNPWGHKEASIDALSGYWWAYDMSWWRPIVLTHEDGVFALEAGTFKQYFQGLGVVK